jgi:hypothetical protein
MNQTILARIRFCSGGDTVQLIDLDLQVGALLIEKEPFEVA